jgi:argininosuccinate lyase
MKTISQHFAEDVMKIFDVETALERRAVIGGTSSKYLHIQLQAANKALNNLST